MHDEKASEEQRTLHPILVKFLDWTPDWEDPDPCAPFPVREMGHDVTGYLAANANFVVRDRKYLVQALSLDVDPYDEIGFFDALLGRTEKEPWIWPLIESFVANSRILGLKRRNFKRREMSKKDRIIQKMPIMRLRLKRNPDLVDRLGEIVNPGDAPEELLVAIFFEYALYHYFALSNEEHAMKYAEIFEIGNEQREKSSYDADDLEVSGLDELSEPDLPDVDHLDDNVEDSEELGRAYFCLARIDDGEIGQDLRDEVLSVLRALIEQIEVGEIPRNLEVLGDLATRSVEIFGKRRSNPTFPLNP